jgi:outer membrane protein assembly factor BamB
MTDIPRYELNSRRRALQLSGTAISTALAGCIGGGVGVLGSDDGWSCPDDTQPFPDDWPLVGYDKQNTSSNPNATGPKDEAEVRWTDGGSQNLWGTPVVADDTVYVQESPNQLTAFARDSGSKRWARQFEPTDSSKSTDQYTGSHLTPAVVGDTVYVGGGDFVVEKNGPELKRVENRVHLYAVDRHTGDVRWTIQPDDFIDTPPVVVDDVVLFVTRVGTVYAVDTMRESVAWTLSIGERDAPLPPFAVDGCQLYLNAFGDGLYAIDVESGELNWNLPAIKAGAAPAIADGTVYVGGRNGVLYAVNPESESVEWQRDLGRAISTASPAVASGTVFVGTADGDSGDELSRIHALDAETGERVWAADTREFVNSSPAVADGVAYVAAHETVYGFDAESGDELWTHEVHGSVRAPLSVTDGTIFAATTYGQLYAFAESE